MSNNQEQEKNNLENQHNETESSEIHQELLACKVQQEELKNKLMRATADFENYKKRAEKDRLHLIVAAQTSVLSDLVAVVNDFERALNECQKQAHSAEQKSWLTGFELIKKSLYKLLQSYDVQEITQTKTFDPQLHEALMHVASAEHTAGDIVTVLEKGFMFKDQVLKPAKVSVAQ